MIEAKTQSDKLKGYREAFAVARQAAESDWHPAWAKFHELYTRRRDGRPMVPVTNLSTGTPGATGSHFLRDDEMVAVNHIQSIIRTIVAATLNRDPSFTLAPLYEGFTAPNRARLAACALNNVWQQEKFNGVIRDAYIDSLWAGRGWVRHGWQSSMTREIAGGSPAALVEDALKAANELSRRGARLGGKSLDAEEITRQLSSFGNKLLLEDKPTLRRISPFDMFFDPLALDPADARWIANRWRCPIAFGRTNTDWNERERKALSASSIDQSQDPGDGNSGEPGEYQGKDVVWIIDFFDLAEGTWCQFTESGENYLRKPSDIPFPYGQPFVWIDNIDDTGNAQPISEVEVIWPHQRDLTDITAELGRDRVQSRGKVLVRSEDAEQLRPALESSDQGMVVPVEMPPGDGTIENAYKFFQPQSRADQLMAQLGLMSQSMTQASGVSDYLRGGGTEGQTATGVNAMQMASANFMGEKASRVRDFIEANAQRVLAEMLAWSRLDYFITTKAYNEDEGRTQDVTIRYGRKHMVGDYRVIVGADSTETKTPQARQARAQAIAATAMPFAQAQIVDLGKLFAFIMKEGFDIDDPSALLTENAFSPQMLEDPNAAEGGAAAMGGVSMTPGTQAGQLGATAAADRTATGDSVPQPEG